MSIAKADGAHVSHIRVNLAERLNSNRESITEHLYQNIDGLISCHFVNDTEAVLSFENNRIDQLTLLDAIQKLNYSVELVSSKSTKIQMRIEGMHCNSCVANIRDSILDLPGAIDIDLTFSGKLATITYNSEILQPNSIIAEIEKLNFQVFIENGSLKADHHLYSNETGKSILKLRPIWQCCNRPARSGRHSRPAGILAGQNDFCQTVTVKKKYFSSFFI